MQGRPAGGAWRQDDWWWLAQVLPIAGSRCHRGEREKMRAYLWFFTALISRDHFWSIS